MKNFTLFLFLVVALFTTSCAPTKYFGTTMVTQDSKVIRNITATRLKVKGEGERVQHNNDTLYYQFVDTTVSISYRDREDTENYWALVTHDSIHSITKKEILSGFRFFVVKKQEDGSFVGDDYTPLKILPKDTIVNTWGSALTVRSLIDETRKHKKYREEYILTLADSTHYIIPPKQIENFYEYNSPNVYKLLRKNQSESRWFIPNLFMTIIGYGEALAFGAIAIATYDEVFGYVSLGFAALGTAFCIPLIKSLKHTNLDPVEAYNQQHYDKSKSEVKLSLNAHINTNGVGLSLQF